MLIGLFLFTFLMSLPICALNVSFRIKKKLLIGNVSTHHHMLSILVVQ